MKTIRLFEMFAGYGGASFALKQLNIPFISVGYSEIDKNKLAGNGWEINIIKELMRCMKLC